MKKYVCLAFLLLGTMPSTQATEEDNKKLLFPVFYADVHTKWHVIFLHGENADDIKTVAATGFQKLAQVQGNHHFQLINKENQRWDDVSKDSNQQSYTINFEINAFSYDQLQTYFQHADKHGSNITLLDTSYKSKYGAKQDTTDADTYYAALRKAFQAYPNDMHKLWPSQQGGSKPNSNQGEQQDGTPSNGNLWKGLKIGGIGVVVIVCVYGIVHILSPATDPTPQKRSQGKPKTRS